MVSSRQQPFCAKALPAGSRIACCIEYDGRRYSGWQIQAHLNVLTVQAELERSLSRVADKPVRVHCAGRTDTGVHACAQIVHFDSPATRSLKSWVMGSNTHLPDDIRVIWAAQVSGEFHARFSAESRRYRYIICNTPVRPALLHGQLTWHRRPLDAKVMHAEAQSLLGERDFSSFRAASCQSRTAMRNVHFVNVQRRGQLVLIDIRANAFLHHMVRNIAGSLMAVGSGRKEKGWIAKLLTLRDRSKAADTAAPDGLYLVEVEYPSGFELPDTAIGPIVWPD